MMQKTTSAITKSLEKPLRINELNALRVLFMFSIFLHHVHVYDGAGYMAVTFFFMLSGFSLTLGYVDSIMSGCFSYKDYANRRISRLLPLHWLGLLLALPLALVEFKSIVIFILTLIMNAFLLQSFIPDMSFCFSFNRVSWFVSATLFFALIFPFLLKSLVLISRKWLISSAIAIVCLYLIVLSQLPKEYYHPILYINPIPRIIDFTIGICLALLFKENVCEQKDRKNVSPLTWDLIVLFSFLLVITISFSFPTSNPYSVAFLYWIPIGCLIYSIASGSILRSRFRVLDNKILNSLGNISFTFYILHQLVMRWTRLIMKYTLHDNSESSIYIIIVLIITLFLSYMCNIYFEKPVMKCLTKK